MAAVVSNRVGQNRTKSNLTFCYSTFWENINKILEKPEMHLISELWKWPNSKKNEFNEHLAFQIENVYKYDSGTKCDSKEKRSALPYIDVIFLTTTGQSIAYRERIESYCISVGIVMVCNTSPSLSNLICSRIFWRPFYIVLGGHSLM